MSRPRRRLIVFACGATVALAFGAAIALDSVVLALAGSLALCGMVAALERIPRSRDW